MFLSEPPQSAGRKRKAEHDKTEGGYDSDEIIVAIRPSRPQRRPLSNLNAPDESNKRLKILDYVHIFPSKHLACHATAAVKAPPGSKRHVHTKAAAASPFASASVNVKTNRPRRISSRPSYAPSPLPLGSSDDELGRPTTSPVKRRRSTILSDQSDFEAEETDSSSQSVAEPMASEDDSVNSLDEDPMDGHDVKIVRRKGFQRSSGSPVDNASRSGNYRPQSTKESKAWRIKRVTTRARGETGLSRDLPPMHDLEDIGRDMATQALKKLGLGNVLNRLSGSTLGLATMCSGTESPIIGLQMIQPGLLQFGHELTFEHLHLSGCELRVATMCSGTESPVLALHMIQDALRRLGLDLEFKHCFSADIVPYKQAYIQRNFEPPLLFRNVTEIEIDEDGQLVASTAWGHKEVIPGNVDMLIVGTSCVDFSPLNDRKKGLHGKGESDDTFHAVVRYCKQARPKFVVIENVRDGPWDAMLEEMLEIGYMGIGALVDTKDFGLPQTRQRGYIVCFDVNVISVDKGQQLKDRFKDFVSSAKRPASSPYSE